MGGRLIRYDSCREGRKGETMIFRILICASLGTLFCLACHPYGRKPEDLAAKRESLKGYLDSVEFAPPPGGVVDTLPWPSKEIESILEELTEENDKQSLVYLSSFFYRLEINYARKYRMTYAVDRNNPMVKSFLELSGLKHERIELLLNYALIIWIDEHYDELPQNEQLAKYRAELQSVMKSIEILQREGR